MEKTKNNKLQSHESDYLVSSGPDHQVGVPGERERHCENTWGGLAQEGGQGHQGEKVPDQGGDGEPPDQGKEEESQDVSPTLIPAY